VEQSLDLGLGRLVVAGDVAGPTKDGSASTSIAAVFRDFTTCTPGRAAWRCSPRLEFG
jgi:hypothetical protein